MTARGKVRRTLAAGFGLGLLLSAFVAAAVLVVPVYDMQLYDRVLQSRNMDTLAVLSLACAAGLALYATLDYLRSACFVAIGEAVGRHLNGAVLEEGVRRAAAGDRRTGAELVRDLNEVQSFLSSGAVAVPLDALCVPLFLVVLFMLHPVFGYLALAGVAAVVLAGLYAEWRVRPALLAAQGRRAAAGQMLSRCLAEPEMADGLGMLPAIARRWSARQGQALAGLNRSGGQALAMAGASRLLRMITQAAVMALGAILVLAGAATPGSLIGANLLMSKVLAPYDHLVGSWRQWALAHAAWRRIDDALSAQAGPAASEPRPDAMPGLFVNGAAVRAPGGRVLLHDVHLRAAPGELILVAGPNGAGKTTLLRLLAGLTPPAEGAVLLDGVPIQGASVQDGGVIGYLPQSVSLLDGSVEENIARFRGGALDRAVDAARTADVHELVGRMARGYDTALRANGSALSGGMRQRIGLARALFDAPRLLVLDEPDASLDAEGADALLRALRTCCGRGAVIIVTSHRPVLRAAADRVIEVRAGRLVDPPAEQPPARSAAPAPSQPGRARVATA